CSGLEPLAFLDYLGMHQMDEDIVAAVVAGARAACDAAGCILLGGETAELPEVYAPGDYDLAGSMLGVGERSQVIDGTEIRVGDAVIGLPSAGLHTNGYALARRLIPPEEWQTHSALLGCTYGEAFLAEHRSYFSRCAGCAPRWACWGWRTSPAAASSIIYRAVCPRAWACAWTGTPGRCRRSCWNCAGADT